MTKDDQNHDSPYTHQPFRNQVDCLKQKQLQINSPKNARKNSKTYLIERKTALEHRKVLEAFHSSSSATDKEGQKEILGRKITTERSLRKTKCFIKRQAAKNTT